MFKYLGSAVLSLYLRTYRFTFSRKKFMSKGCYKAKDGIRVIGVTGVQTCALPIYVPLPHQFRHLQRRGLVMVFVADDGVHAGSEERRVGKECRSRWSPYH